MNSVVRVDAPEFSTNSVDSESFEIESLVVENLVTAIENVEETILERYKDLIKPSRVCLQRLPFKCDDGGSDCLSFEINDTRSDSVVKLKKCFVLLEDLKWTNASLIRENATNSVPQVTNILIKEEPNFSSVSDLDGVIKNINHIILQDDINNESSSLKLQWSDEESEEEINTKTKFELNDCNDVLVTEDIENSIKTEKGDDVLVIEDVENSIKTEKGDDVLVIEDVKNNSNTYKNDDVLVLEDVENIIINTEKGHSLNNENSPHIKTSIKNIITIESDDDLSNTTSKSQPYVKVQTDHSQIILKDVKIKLEKDNIFLSEHYEQFKDQLNNTEKVEDLNIKQEIENHELLIPVIKLKRLNPTLLNFDNGQSNSRKFFGVKRKRDCFSSDGPRVKRVCRIETEILGYPLARFKTLCVRKSHYLKQSKNKLKKPKPKNVTKDKKRVRFNRCRKCEGCLKRDCKKCRWCRDMVKYGGPGICKQACSFRKCLNPNLPDTISDRKHITLPLMLDNQTVKNSSKTKYQTIYQKLLTKYFGGTLALKKRAFLRTSRRKNDSNHLKISSEKDKPNTGFKNYLESLSQLQENEVSKSTITKRLFIRRLIKKGRFQGLYRLSKSLENKSNFPKPGCIWPYMKMDYDDENTWTIGAALISEIPHFLRVACHTCGSTGMEDLIYCALCCEPFHTFCLESDEIPSSLDFQNWCCNSCQFCSVCELSHDIKSLLTCHICSSKFHSTCLGSNYQMPPLLGQQWCCLLCARCERCGTNENLKQSTVNFYHSVLCTDCSELPNDTPCSICQKVVVTVNHSKALICLMCCKYVHCKCDNILDDLFYTAFEVTELKDQFICSICSPDLSSKWKLAVVSKLNAKLNAVMNTFVKVFEITLQSKESLRNLGSLTLTSCNTEKEQILINEEEKSFFKFERLRMKLNNKDYCSIKRFMEDVLSAVDFEKQFTYENWADLVNFLFTCVVAVCPWASTLENINGSSTNKFVYNLIVAEHNYFQPLPISLAQIFPQQISIYRNESNSANPYQTTRAINASSSRVCSICAEIEGEYYKHGGRLLFSGKDDWVHINCAFWSNTVTEKNGVLEGVFSAISQGNKTICKGCEKLGATLRCCAPNCDVSYHFKCATRFNVLWQNDKKIFCSDHRQLGTDNCVNDKLLYSEHKVLINVNETFNFKKCVRSDVDVSRISVLSGSLTVESFGDLYSASNYGIASIPTNFCCTRVFWSTNNPNKRVIYRCQAILVDPDQDNQMPSEENNITISHESDVSILEVNDPDTQMNIFNSENENLHDEDPADVYLLYDDDIDEESALDVFRFLCSEDLINFDVPDNKIDDGSESKKISETAYQEIDLALEVVENDAKLPVNTSNGFTKQMDHFFNTPQFKIGEENLPPEANDYAAPTTLNESLSGEELRSKNSLSEVNFQSPCCKLYDANLNTDRDCYNDKRFNCLHSTCESNRHTKSEINFCSQGDHLKKYSSMLESRLINHDNSMVTLQNCFKNKRNGKRKPGSHLKKMPLKRCRVIAEKTERLSSLCHSSFTSFTGDTVTLNRTWNGNLRNGLHTRKSSSNDDFSDDSLLVSITPSISNCDDLTFFNSTNEICKSSDLVTMNNDITAPSSICLSRGCQTDSYCESDQVFSGDLNINSRPPESIHCSGRHNRQISESNLNQLKCPKCRRVYKSESSLQRHFQTCDFEISSSEDEEADQSEVSPDLTTSKEKSSLEVAKSNLSINNNSKLSIASISSATEKPPSLAKAVFRRRGRPKKTVTRNKCQVLPRNSAYAINAMHSTELYTPFGTLSPSSQFVIQSNINPLVQDPVLQPVAMINDQSFSIIENVIPATISCSYPISNIHLNLAPTLPVQPILPSSFNEPNSLTIFDSTLNSSNTSESLLLPSFSQYEVGVNNISQFVQQPVYQLINDYGCPEQIQFISNPFEIQPSCSSQSSYNVQSYESFQANQEVLRSDINEKQIIVEPMVEVKPLLPLSPIAEAAVANIETLISEELNAKTSVENVLQESSAVCDEIQAEKSIESPKNDNLLETNTDDKIASSSFAPHLAFEITSDDGYRIQSDNIDEAWQTIAEMVNNERSAMRSKRFPISGIKGLKMIGVTHNAIRYCLEQLPGARQYKNENFLYNSGNFPIEFFYNRSGCARTEQYKSRRFKLHHRCGFRQQTSGFVDIEDVSFIKMTRRCSNGGSFRTNVKESVSVFRSSIHGLGLLCKRNIEAGEQVIQYAGEIIRSIVADKREQYYEKKRIGCYMFRIDDNEVVDATINGNAARFINHSCEPNCFSKVVTVNNKKHIGIFSLRRIVSGEELTYDYKFPIEDVKIPCTCGSRKCRRFLN